MPKIFVYLWLDIEDYVTKEADDPALIFINILKRHNVPVTCKLVAEEVRALTERGRQDVISAVSSCDVGYHSDTHSQHPTVWEYLADLDVQSGAKEFELREERGLKLMQSVFNRTPSCFGHPGVMWAPHVYPALRAMGIRMYLDETAILNLNDAPYWYCGVLNLNGAGKNLIYFDYSFEKPDGIESMKSKFNRIYTRLHKGKGGAISICLHPHTAVNQKVWDVVNFARGQNRTKQEYERPPPQPPEVTQRAYEDFEKFIEYISSFENVQWITASDAIRIFKSHQWKSVERDKLREITKHFVHSQDYMKMDENYLSPAEAFYIVTNCLAHLAESEALPNRIELKEPLGPLAPARSKGRKILQTTDFLTAAKTAKKFMNAENSIPVSLNVGGYASVSPHDFLATACKMLDSVLAGKSLADKIVLCKGKSPQVERLHLTKFKSDCKWVVLPPNFNAPKIFEQACLQAWTLKPAVPSL